MSNKIDTPERLLMTYNPVFMRFYEEDVNNPANDKTGSFRLLDTLEAQVIRQDKYTIVILDDGSKGMSECMEGDEFSRKDGLRIAFNRAIIAHLQKQIKEISYGK